jgi:hypothetical protein
MAIVKRTRGAQYPLVSEFVFNYNDGMAPLSALNGASVESNPKAGVTDFGSKAQPTGVLSGVQYTANPNTGANYFEMLSLPSGAQVIGGDVQVEVPFAGPSTVTLGLGDANTGAMYLAAGTSLVATAFTNQPTTLTNAGADPRVMTMGNATANGVTAVGQEVSITGCTGASAAYNGTYIVDSFSATSVVMTNPALTTSLTLAGTIAATFITGRTALLLPSENAQSDAYAGADLRGVLTFSGGQAATQGRVRVRVMYTIDGRTNEASAV